MASDDDAPVSNLRKPDELEAALNELKLSTAGTNIIKLKSAIAEAEKLCLQAHHAKELQDAKERLEQLEASLNLT